MYLKSEANTQIMPVTNNHKRRLHKFRRRRRQAPGPGTGAVINSNYLFLLCSIHTTFLLFFDLIPYFLYLNDTLEGDRKIVRHVVQLEKIRYIKNENCSELKRTDCGAVISIESQKSRAKQKSSFRFFRSITWTDSGYTIYTYCRRTADYISVCAVCVFATDSGAQTTYLLVEKNFCF